MTSGVRLRRAATTALLVAAIAAVGLLAATPTPAAAHEAGPEVPLDHTEDPARGRELDGLVDAAGDACVSSFRLRLADPGKVECTHGPDDPRPGQDVSGDASAGFVAPAAPPAVQCYGSGSDGPRVEAIYAVASGRTDRYAQLLATLQTYAANVDSIFSSSASQTGGVRHVRFVTDAGCVVAVRHVVLSAAGDDTFSNTINELIAQGYSRSDRKYLVWVDANVYCGIGNVSGDDRKTSGNWNNSGPDYARADAGCWGGHTEAHELTHTLGGVQLSAPHTSQGYHCVDEYDVMCYSDSPNYPPMQYFCTPSGANENILDCRHDDYFHTSPPAGNYLATHWNVADNQFLATAHGGPQLELFPDLPPPPTTAATNPARSRPTARLRHRGARHRVVTRYPALPFLRSMRSRS